MTIARVPLILGAGLVGYKGRFSDAAEVQKWIDMMVQHEQHIIDTARWYSEGTAEPFIAQLDVKGMRIDTKIYPRTPGEHEPAKLKETFKLSLEALRKQKIHVFYLHAPDRSVPFEDTLEAVNELYSAGYFEEFGLSNYMSFEVAEIVGICERRGFVKPTVYQGVYNLLDRAAEAELFPCLRKFNISFAAYSVLAGGYLTGKLLDAKPEVGSHFDAANPQNWFYNQRYLQTAAALQELKAVADKHNLRLAEVAYRWLQHHSILLPEDYGVILGASNAQQLESAISDCEKGPLPQEVADQCEKAWLQVKGQAKQYWL